MQETLRGIVLRTVKYGDASLIVDLFTERYGRMSFMASTSRAKRSVRSVSFWQPLSMVEFSAELRPNAGKLPRPADVRSYYNYQDLPFSPVKSTLALFLSEFLSAALREEKDNPLLYKYVESSLQWLDMVESPASMANFHLVFLMHLSRFIGIYPNLDLKPNLNPKLNPKLSTLNSTSTFWLAPIAIANLLMLISSAMKRHRHFPSSSAWIIPPCTSSVSLVSSGSASSMFSTPTIAFMCPISQN